MAKLVTVAALLLSCEAFLAPRIITFRPLSTKLYLEDHIARMIDAELQRLQHKNEIDRAWHQKNEKFIERDIPTGFDFEERTMMENVLGPRQRRKDKALARDDPQAYCADRCVSTGNCEVFEDMYVYSISDDINAYTKRRL